MKISLLLRVSVLALGTLITGAGHAAVIGVFGLSGTGATNADNIITGQGHTYQNLGGLDGASLAGIDVLWILNPSNSAHPVEMTANGADIAAFVSGGGTLMYHDRRVTDAETVLPGAAGATFVRDFTDDADINVIDNTTLVTNGPAGIIDDTTLDGGNSSSHGYHIEGTLAGVQGILSRSDAGQLVDILFGYGLGFVYYSTIPLDFYLGGGGNNANFLNVYAPNVVAFAASLEGAARVPEPQTLMLMGIGLLLLSFRARRQPRLG